jgi:hypothetical protein
MVAPINAAGLPPIASEPGGGAIGALRGCRSRTIPGVPAGLERPTTSAV